MPEIIPPGKPVLGETLSMPLLPNFYPIETPRQNPPPEEVEIGSGDEERLLPTDLLIDDDDLDPLKSSPDPLKTHYDDLDPLKSNSKSTLRKTWSWTPADEELIKKKSESNMRHLERAIKSLSIDPNVSLSRKF